MIVHFNYWIKTYKKIHQIKTEIHKSRDTISKKQFQEAFKIINEITEFGSPVTHWVLKAKICEQLSQFQASLIVTMK